MNGSPVYPSLQVQIGECAITWHRAPRPQAPSQGSRHLRSIQASCSLHSELTRHSGRHDGGEPTWPDRHEQAAALLELTVHSLYGPQGDGEHGDCGGPASNFM